MNQEPITVIFQDNKGLLIVRDVLVVPRIGEKVSFAVKEKNFIVKDILHIYRRRNTRSSIVIKISPEFEEEDFYTIPGM